MQQGCRLARLLAKNTGNFVRETKTALWGVGVEIRLFFMCKYIFKRHLRNSSHKAVNKNVLAFYSIARLQMIATAFER